MSQKNKDIVKRFLTELQVDKRLDVINELVVEDFVRHTADVCGQEELKQARLSSARAAVDYLRALAIIDALSGKVLENYGIQIAP